MTRIVTESITEARLVPTGILDLRPLQMTAGFIEVDKRREIWRPKLKKDPRKFLQRHLVETILGPEDSTFFADGHHMLRGLYKDKVDRVFTMASLDYRKLSWDEFWFIMDWKGLVFPYDRHGKRRDYEDIPKTVADLKDDPFRSLAWDLRHKGGYAKDVQRFAEFVWADFLRRRISRELVRKNFSQASMRAYELAKSSEASHLPGWCGPVEV